MENEKGNVIVSISAQDIYQHPDNPRKDLGDLSELSDSIAKKGIMQNLTVIQGHWDEDRNWHEDGYTLIIGHRRFAAAKMAGVQELPAGWWRTWIRRNRFLPCWKRICSGSI